MSNTPEDTKLDEILDSYRDFWITGNPQVGSGTAQTKKAITQTMLDALPEKKRKMTYIEACKDVKLYELATENHGYNQAISEMETAIKKMGGERCVIHLMKR